MYYFKNEMEMPIVVFCERGVLYCKQKLEPGEAVGFSRGQAGRFPFSICCSVGTELPTVHQSFTNFMAAARGPTVAILATTAAASAIIATGGAAGPAVAAGAAAGAAAAGGTAAVEILSNFVTNNTQNFSYRQPHFGTNIFSRHDEYYEFFGGGQDEIGLRPIDNVDGVTVLDAVM